MKETRFPAVAFGFGSSQLQILARGKQGSFKAQRKTPHTVRGLKHIHSTLRHLQASGVLSLSVLWRTWVEGREHGFLQTAFVDSGIGVDRP